MSTDYLYREHGGGGIVYVIGHRHPDTDSIASAIGYAHLRQKQDYNVVACYLDNLTAETKFLLEKFELPFPLKIRDARPRLDETVMDDANRVSEDAILRDVIERFDEQHKVFTVQDKKGRLLGIVTNSSIGETVLQDTSKSVDLLKKTSVEDMARAIEGKLYYMPEESRHNGNVSIIALSANNLKFYDLKDQIVIMGNDTNFQLEAIDKGTAVLILVQTKEIGPMVLRAAREKDCAIILASHDAMNTSRFLYYSIPVKLVMGTDLVVFNDQEFVEDGIEKMMRSRHRAYPIVDERNRVMGLTSRYRLLNAPKRRYVLVDHNEALQSVPNIEKADVIEIIDHHRLGDLTSDKPVAFRNEPVGATATIITKMFIEQNIQPDINVAGLLLSAIIADTLNFKSPTTTNEDKMTAKYLAEYTDLDINALAEEIFKASSEEFLNDLNQLLEFDVKNYNVSDQSIMISQYTMYHLNETTAIDEELSKVLDQRSEEQNIYLWIMMFTSARDNGSIFYAGGPGKKIMPFIFPNTEGEINSFQKGVVSRKSQVVPRILSYLRGGLV
ncbi:MAG: putative manganese-dependent inorganic diphosphatase [Saccharofermentanales bacterium]|jgi:manganese-dependent inorganic pyrophosphatase